MGIVKCGKHGRQGFYEACEHAFVRIKQDYFTGIHEVYYWRMLVCDDCWEKYEFDKYESVARRGKKWLFGALPDHENDDLDHAGYRKIYEAIDRRICCQQCVAEAEVMTARRMGLPDPYPVYERTLMKLEEAKGLYNHLAGKFDFKQAIPWPGTSEHLALFVQPGGFTYPLTIKMYYITEKEKQDRILQMIDDFLKPTGSDQAKVIFFEAENIIKTETAHGYGVVSRGEEVIVREEYLNC